MGPVWDFDLSSTTVTRYGGARPDGWVIFQDFGADPWKPPFWWRRLLANEGFVEQVIRRWRLLRNGALRLSNLFHVIDEWSALLDEAQARNYERWPVALKVPIGDEPVAFPTSAGEVDEFRSFLEARLSWIDANINWLRPAGTVAPDEAGGPAVTAGGSHVLDVVVRGRHNHELVHRYYNGIQWSGWINLSGDLA